MKNKVLLSSALVIASIGMAGDVYAVTTTSTTPVLVPLAAEYDAVEGVALPITFSDTSTTQAPFTIIATPKNLFKTGTTQHDTTANNLPSVEWDWTPAAAQAGKVYTVTFVAQETTNTKVKSKPVKTKIRVWPNSNHDLGSVQRVAISRVNLSNGTLTILGKATLSNILSATEKATFLARTNLTANVTEGADGSGTAIDATAAVVFSSGGKGDFTITIPNATTGTKCSLTVEFEGPKASHKIGGAPKTCTK